MNVVRVLSRLALLSLAAAAIAGLTWFCGGFVRVTPPGARYQEYHRYPPRAPRGSEYPGLIRAVLEVALFAVGGRLALRMRLAPVPSSERQPILLDLNRHMASAEVIVAQRVERRPI